MKTLDPFEMTDIMNNLHTIRAHMLFYNSLLADFQKAGNTALQGYSRSNIYDSRQTTKLTEAQVRDSAGSHNSLCYMIQFSNPSLQQ